MAVTVWQVPVPLQVRAGVNVVPEQVEAAQVVPVACSRQAPLPLQNPSVPQLAAPWSAHWPSGSWPAGTEVQVPSVPASAHDLQVPAHVLAQQIPSSHSAELHSAGAAQTAPIGFLPQLLAEQVLGELQSAEVAHDVRHAPFVPQT